ncbi:disulfide bond formation protein DsbB [Azonexus hydrophilus]
MVRLCARIVAAFPVRAWFSALALGVFGVAAAGMVLQQMLSLSPCPYCIFQRLLYLLIGGLALLGFVWPLLRQLWCAAIMLLAAAGAGIALYQSWLQLYPDTLAGCGMSEPDAVERLVDWLGMAWPKLFLATGFCASREWEFIGLSMANWSVLLFAGVLFWAVLLFRSKG